MSEFRVKESHLAGFSVMTDQVGDHLNDIARFIRQNGGSRRGKWSGVMDALEGPVDDYAEAAASRLITAGGAVLSMGDELNRAAWVYHGTDESAYQQVERIGGKNVVVGAKAWSGERASYRAGPAPRLSAPDVAEADIEAMLDESGGLLNRFNDLIASVTGFSPVAELVKPLSGNWNALSAAGDALIAAGHACNGVGSGLEGNVSRLGGTWDGAAATSFDGYAGLITDGLDSEGPLNRTVGRAYKALAAQIEQAAGVVVQTLSDICNKLAERAATSWVPLYGQYKLVRFLKECVDVFNQLKAMVEEVKRTVESVKAVIAAAKDPVKFIKGKVQDKMQPLLDKLNEKKAQLDRARDQAVMVKDLASVNPVHLKNVPDILKGDGLAEEYSIGKHPTADDR